MKNYQPNYLSMLLLMFVCIASCSNETTSGPGFEIGGTPAESVYQIPSDRKVLLPGTGFQTGDIVRLTDTGISHNTYRVEAAVEEDGAVITLPGNFVDGRYELSSSAAPGRSATVWPYSARIRTGPGSSTVRTTTG